MHGLKTSLKFLSHSECCPRHMAVPVYVGSHLFPLGQMTMEH